MSESAGEAVPSVPSAAASGLTALRRRMLEELAEPASASELARRLELPRQKVNYHLRTLEKLGLVELVDERQRRGFVERRMRALDSDRFSSGYLLTAASRLAADTATLRERARAAGMPVATFTLEVEIDFATPAELRAFADELTGAVRRLAEEHHRPDEPRARRHRIVIGAHPAITKTSQEAATEAAEHRKATDDA